MCIIRKLLRMKWHKQWLVHYPAQTESILRCRFAMQMDDDMLVPFADRFPKLVKETSAVPSVIWVEAQLV